jgi:hypothetical protein
MVSGQQKQTGASSQDISVLLRGINVVKRGTVLRELGQRNLTQTKGSRQEFLRKCYSTEL